MPIGGLLIVKTDVLVMLIGIFGIGKTGTGLLNTKLKAVKKAELP